MDITAFRTTFPEFADEAKYPDTMVTTWATIGETLLNTERWATLYTTGLQLYVAHQITLAYQDLSQANKGRSPGSTGGVIGNKGVGDVSVSYDTHAITLESAGNFNMTRYGREFWNLMMIVGMGGYQL